MDVTKLGIERIAHTFVPGYYQKYCTLPSSVQYHGGQNEVFSTVELELGSEDRFGNADVY